jgi:hypothetical protein
MGPKHDGYDSVRFRIGQLMLQARIDPSKHAEAMSLIAQYGLGAEYEHIYGRLDSFSGHGPRQPPPDSEEDQRKQPWNVSPRYQFEGPTMTPEESRKWSMIMGPLIIAFLIALLWYFATH